MPLLGIKRYSTSTPRAHRKLVRDSSSLSEGKIREITAVPTKMMAGTTTDKAKLSGFPSLRASRKNARKKNAMTVSSMARPGSA